MRPFRLIATAALLATAGHVYAVCLPVQHYVYVGNDAQCNTTDIQTAIESAVCPGTNVVLTSELTYSGQRITVDKPVNIVGSTAACSAPPVVCDPSTGCSGGGPPAKIGVSGDGMHPVFYVTSGGAVGFRNLTIGFGGGASNSLSGGGGIGIFGNATQVTLDNVELLDNSGGYGGGVAFYGDGSLTLDGVSVHDNQAASGGGISAVSSAIGHIDVTIANDSYLFTGIYKNSASDMGGGIYVDGNTHLKAVTANAQIQNNQAAQEGGGIAVGGGTVADIGMVGEAIDSNSSGLFGGGIAAIPDSSGNAIVRLFNLVGSQPLTLSNNTAAQWGGGLYVYPGNASLHATACLFDVDLAGNHAPQEGSAIQIGDYGRLLVNPVGDAECDPAAVAVLGAVPNVFSGAWFTGNSGLDATNHYTNSAVIQIDGTDAQVQAHRLHLEQNGGGYMIRAQNAAGSSIAFSQCLLDENLTLNELVNLQGAPVSFDGCTFARNNISGATVFAFDSGLSLTRSIVNETGTLTLWSDLATGITAEYLYLSGPAQTTNSTVVYGDPLFVDPDSGDFHLQASSPAVDFAPDGNESGPTDLDSRPREVDKANVNRFGPRDLGAYEISPACFHFDTVFCNNFESTQ